LVFLEMTEKMAWTSSRGWIGSQVWLIEKGRIDRHCSGLSIGAGVTFRHFIWHRSIARAAKHKELCLGGFIVFLQMRVFLIMLAPTWLLACWLVISGLLMHRLVFY
jgi:hypothetical protein